MCAQSVLACTSPYGTPCLPCRSACSSGCLSCARPCMQHSTDCTVPPLCRRCTAGWSYMKPFIATKEKRLLMVSQRRVLWCLGSVASLCLLRCMRCYLECCLRARTSLLARSFPPPAVRTPFPLLAAAAGSSSVLHFSLICPTFLMCFLFIFLQLPAGCGAPAVHQQPGHHHSG